VPGVSLADAFAPVDIYKPPRILLIDLERRAGQAFAFDQKVRGGFIPVSQFTRRPSTLCFAARWWHKRTEFHAVWDSEDPHHLARESWRLVDEADVVVTYYGTGADIPWLMGDWKRAKLPEPSPYKHVDLYRTAKRFGYVSNGLAEVCHQLELGGKQGKYSPWEAEACVAGDEKARRKMRKYNMGDVGPTSLEGAFDEYRPFIKGLNLSLYGEDDRRACWSCNRDDTLVPDGHAMTIQTRYPAYRCAACGAVSRGKNRAASVPMRGVTS
jgi:hypothetical protein